MKSVMCGIISAALFPIKDLNYADIIGNSAHCANTLQNV